MKEAMNQVAAEAVVEVVVARGCFQIEVNSWGYKPNDGHGNELESDNERAIG